MKTMALVPITTEDIIVPATMDGKVKTVRQVRKLSPQKVCSIYNRHVIKFDNIHREKFTLTHCGLKTGYINFIR